MQILISLSDIGQSPDIDDIGTSKKMMSVGFKNTNDVQRHPFPFMSEGRFKIATCGRELPKSSVLVAQQYSYALCGVPVPYPSHSSLVILMWNFGSPFWTDSGYATALKSFPTSTLSNAPMPVTAMLAERDREPVVDAGFENP